MSPPVEWRHLSLAWKERFPYGLPSITPLLYKTEGASVFKKLHTLLFAPQVYILNMDFIYVRENGGRLFVPRKFCTDFASTPRFSWPLGFTPQGLLLIPALLHDFGYRHDFYLDEKEEKIYEGKGRAFHDKLFREISNDINDMHVFTFFSYLALDIAGFLAWRSAEKRRTGEVDLFGPYKELYDDQDFETFVPF